MLVKTNILMQRINLIFGVMMGILYLAAGGFIFISAALLPNMDPLYRKILGLIICLYGIFRFYKVIKSYNEYKTEDYDAQDK